MDHPGRGRAVLTPEAAITEPEVQRGACHEHQVSLPEGDRPGPRHQQWMPGWQDAASLAVGNDRKLELLGCGSGCALSAIEPYVRAQDQHRPDCRGEQPRNSGDRLRIRKLGRCRASAASATGTGNATGT